MTDRIHWEIEKIQEREKELQDNIDGVNRRVSNESKELNERLLREIKSVNRRIDNEVKDIAAQLIDYQSFKLDVLQKISVAFHKIDDLRASDTFLKRTFTTALIGGVFSAILSFVVWFLQ